MYAELVCRSNVSFLRGASHPEELVASAQRLGLSALALTDDDGLYGVVKAHLHARQLSPPLRLLVASRLTLTDLGTQLCVYAENAAGYAQLCQLVSQGRMRSPKGQGGVTSLEVAERARGLLALLPRPQGDARALARLAEAFPGRFYVGVCRTLAATDEEELLRAVALARALSVPCCAHNDVHAHGRARQPLQDVLTAIRLSTTVEAAGTALFSNAERTLKGPAEMARLFADMPEVVGRTLELADACRFSLDELKYEFSREELPPGLSCQQYLEVRVREGLAVRYPGGVPAKVQEQVARELSLIEALDYPGYFLALWDIVRFARERGILCQGRGSAANSAVCYALQITSVDPVRMGLLFERFLSMERKEPPDIDVDFEHERREEVLQYVYQKHGRHRAAMVCELICYRGRLAAREVGKALGLSLDQVDRLSGVMDWGWARGDGEVPAEALREAGLSPDDPKVHKVLALARELEGTPRHLSIHTGGFVITHGPLTELVPVENAAMEARTVVQWEKDDLNALSILKVDLLGLGMLTALAKCFALIEAHSGVQLSMATLPAEDPRVYDMICDADTIGVFQIESRAQMNMLPRLKPRTFYDLVIEVAIIRPGPIVGDMVHPYLRRRDGLEAVSYPSPEVKGILEKTLGVPLFQEQAMRLAMVAAGFTSGEADALRRALSHKRALTLIVPFRERFAAGCQARGYPPEFAAACFEQFKGFAHYGFPESHAASFALIAYASAYVKCYFPAAFTAALINSQPMGFYAANTLVEDARRHGVDVLPIDVNASSWDCTLEGRVSWEPPSAPAGRSVTQERLGEKGPALRLGLRLVKGLSRKAAERIAQERGEGYLSVADLAARARVARHELARLALAGCLSSVSGSRREALWELQALGSLDEDDLFYGLPMDDTRLSLPPLSVAERMSADFATTGISLGEHPVTLLRPKLSRLGALNAEQLARARAGKRARVGGLVIVRQRPGTARGFVFLSVEDETGIANFVVEPGLVERYRREVLSAVLVLGEGVVERSGKVVNLKIAHLEPLLLDPGPGHPSTPLPLEPRSWR